MTIKIDYFVSENRILRLELSTKDKETHSYFADRPELLKSIENSIKDKLFFHVQVNDKK